MTEALTLLEDEDLTVKMPRTGFVAGHIIVTAKTEAMILEELEAPTLTKMLTIANRLAGLLFEALDCDGTNLLIQNGVAAGQIDDSVILHLIPRWEEDGLDLSWTSTEAGEAMLGEVHDRLTFARDHDETPKEPEETRSVQNEQRSPDVVDGENNYYAKQLKRGLE